MVVGFKENLFHHKGAVRSSWRFHFMWLRLLFNNLVYLRKWNTHNFSSASSDSYEEVSLSKGIRYNVFIPTAPTINIHAAHQTRALRNETVTAFKLVSPSRLELYQSNIKPNVASRETVCNKPPRGIIATVAS